MICHHGVFLLSRDLNVFILDHFLFNWSCKVFCLKSTKFGTPKCWWELQGEGRVLSNAGGMGGGRVLPNAGGHWGGKGTSFSPMGENPLWISNSNIKTHSWCKLTSYEPGKLQKWFQCLSKMDYFSWPLSRKYLCWTLRYNLPLNTFFFLQLMSLWKAVLIIKECSYYTIFL